MAAMLAQPDDQARVVVAGRYELGDVIGSGGMGIVHRARDRHTGGAVAVKAMRGDDVEHLLRFKNEFRLCADLHHPNLARLGELVEWNDGLYIAMELVEGEDLISHVRPPRWVGAPPDRTPTGPGTRARRARTPAPVAVEELEVDAPLGLAYDEPRVRAAFAQLATGLTALHDAGVLHRDLKPSNVLVTPAGRVVILDFGLAVRHAEGRQLGDVVAVGSAAYMAPEQAASRPVGPAADWFAFGVMLYEALTGRLPWDGEASALLAAKLTRDAPWVTAFAPAAPPDLAALADELIRRDPAARPRAPSVRRRLALVERGPGRLAPTEPGVPAIAALVGRDAELAALDAAFAAAQRAGRVSLLVGESGLGKSAVMTHALARLRAAVPALIVLESRCREREALAFKALDGAVDQLAQWLAAAPATERAAVLPARRDRLAQLFPALVAVPELGAALAAAPPITDLAQARRDAFDSFRAMIARLAERSPVVLAIDDLQHADPDSVELLEHLLEPDVAPPLWLVATARPCAIVDGLRARAAAGRIVEVEACELAPLGEAASRALVAASLAVARGGPDRLDDVVAAGGGHPGLLLELVRAVTDPAAPPTTLSRDVDELLRRRVERLPLAARELLYLVVAEGGPLPLAVVAAAATDGDLGALRQQLDPLVAARLAVISGTGPADTIEPYHDRITDAIRAELDPWALRQRHEELARALEAARPAIDPTRVLRHWQAAGRDDEVRRLAPAAADRAFAALELRRAARLYRLALAGPVPPAEALRLRTALGDVSAVFGDGEKAAEAYLAAAELAATVEPAARARLRRRAAEQLIAAGKIGEGMARLDEILAEAGMAMARTPQAAVARMAWAQARLWWRRRRPAGPGADAAGAARATGGGAAAGTDERIAACWTAAVGLSTIDTVRGAEYQARLLRLALDRGDPSTLCRALALDAIYVGAAGEAARDRADEVLARARGFADTTGAPGDRAWVTLGEAGLAWLRGEFVHTAAAAADAGEQFAAVPGATWERRTVRVFEIYARYFSGELDAFARLMAQSLRDAAQAGDRYTAVQLRLAHASAWWLMQDDPAASRAHADRAIAEWAAPRHQFQHNYHKVALTQAALYEGDGAAAHAHAVEAWRRARAARMFRVEHTAINLGILRARAAIAAATAPDAAPALRRRRLAEATDAADAVARLPATWSRGLTAMIRGAVAGAHGDRDGAITELAVAEVHLERAGMRAYAWAARARRGALLGGDTGALLVARSHAELVAVGVRRPDRMIAMILPGA